MALILILSGAIGNFIDRIRIRAVIDFISVHYHDYYWPAFNVADAFITVGVAIMIIDILFFQKHDEVKE
ncbi:signal peptidase II [Thermodesulfobacteriota bacterium]